MDDAGVVADFHGKKTEPSCNPLCRKCQSEPKGIAECGRAVSEITDRLRGGAFPNGGFFQTCPLGLKHLALPLVLGDQFLGALLAGGVLTESLNEEKKKELLESAREFLGCPVSELEGCLAHLPVLSPSELRDCRELVAFGLDQVKRRQEAILLRQERSKALDETWVERRGFHEIVGRAPAMQRLYHLLDKLGDNESTVLIQGENGTGKEMVAKAIHFHSSRRNQNFISQSCSAFNENLLESELFGHVKGSFTGAIRDKKGLFEVADGGTFLMDEIGEMSPTLQVKLLRVLQEGTFIPVGGTQPKKVKVRIIAATNRDLRKMVEDGKFREDLFYRINVINVYVPALRERRSDIPLLVDHFLKKYARNESDPLKQFSDEAMDALLAYNWPGNVRQLENEVQRAVVLAGRSPVIEKEMLSPNLLSSTGALAQVKLGGKLRDTLGQFERQILLEGLRKYRWNKSKLSRELGISRATLIGKVGKYGLIRDKQT